MKVFWTQTALRQLAAIQQGLAHDSPAFARRMVDRLISRSDQIAGSASRPRPVNVHEDPGILVVNEGPYRVLYKLAPNGVHVLAVLFATRELL